MHSLVLVHGFMFHSILKRNGEGERKWKVVSGSCVYASTGSGSCVHGFMFYGILKRKWEGVRKWKVVSGSCVHAFTGSGSWVHVS